MNQTKEELRDKLLAARRLLTIEEVEQKSKPVIHSFVSHFLYKRRKRIMCYASFDNEVETHKLLKQIIDDKGFVILPYVNHEKKQIIPFAIKDLSRLKKSRSGILEPNPETEKIFSKFDIELVICPGVVFDNKGKRIGYGKGYYDRFLANLMTINVAFSYDFQLIENIPPKGHDITMDYLFTESKTYDIKSKSVSDNKM